MGDALAQGLAYGLTGAALLSYALGALEARTILATSANLTPTERTAANG